MSRLKHEFQARYVITVIMVNYIPRFNFFQYAAMFSRIFEAKKKTKTKKGKTAVVLNLVEISKDFLIIVFHCY